MEEKVLSWASLSEVFFVQLATTNVGFLKAKDLNITLIFFTRDLLQASNSESNFLIIKLLQIFSPAFHLRKKKNGDFLSSSFSFSFKALGQKSCLETDLNKYYKLISSKKVFSKGGASRGLL